MQTIQQQAHVVCRKAIKEGKLTLRSTCEICGAKRGSKRFTFEKSVEIVPHHYRGYAFPLDVWSVCRSCNRRLVGKHDDSLTIDQARQFLFTPQTIDRLLKIYAQNQGDYPDFCI